MPLPFRGLLNRSVSGSKRGRKQKRQARRPGWINLEKLEDRTLLSSSQQTALDAYVAAADPAYQYSLNSTLTGPGYTDYVINMISQTWRSPSEVNNTVWQHWLQVIVPTTVKTHTGVLEIGGGSNGSAPTSPDGIGLQTALTTGAITTVLPTVPNEPLTFAGQSQSFTEDQIVAYSFEQYLNGGDQNWPVLLPMVKSAVKAMDTTQSFVSTQSGGTLSVDNFIVAGASKRGWTTWLTPAVDSRVVAIVPFVYDTLNQSQSVPNLADTYVGVTQHIVGGFPDAVQDYTNDGVFAASGTPQGNALQQIVDPFTYINRPTYDIPKYMVDSTGDQFFVPDSSLFYINQLPGQNYLRSVPNTDHGLNQDAVNGAINFMKVLLDGVQLPRYGWTITNAGATINLHTIDAPASVTMWQATNPNNRDFRLEDFGPNWTSSPLADQGGGNYVASVNVPSTGATSFFIQMTYNVDGVTLTFTTSVSTVPLFTPTLAVADAGGTYNGKPFAASAAATGAAGFPVPGAFAYTYYNGNTASGTGSSTPPTNPGTYTVVASFASSDPVYLNAQSAPVTFTIAASSLNNGVLTILGDGSAAIAITLSDSGALDVSYNGVHQQYAAGTVTSIVVSGAGGSDSLTVIDTNTTSGQTYTLTPTGITRSNAQPIAYSNVPTFTLDAGNLGNTVNWQGDASGEIDYVFGGTGVNTVNFGDSNNTLNSFSGTPVFEGQGSNNTVNVIDQGNAAARHYVITSDSLSTNGGSSFGYGVDIQTANIFLGSGGNTIDWQGTPANSVVTVYTGSGTNTVNLGDANHTLDDFLGTPVLQGQGKTTANVDDQGSTAAHTYVITPTSLTRDGGTGYLYGLTATNYNLGSGGNTIDWQGTAAGEATTVATGTGTNTINVGSGGNSLDEFQGTPVLVGQGSHNTANYYDQGGSAAFWSGFGGNAQHTAISPTPAQPLDGVSWQTKVDLQPQYDSSGELLIHYGEPLVTKGNTLIVPVKTGASGGFELAAVDGNSGAVRWTVSTDYVLPNFDWTPSYSPVMTATGRVYFAGAGGTVYYFDDPDSATAPVVHQLAFYGLSNYQANSAGFNGSVFIDTPLTADANGDIFFGFRVQGTAPAPLNTTQSGYARVDANGTGASALVGAITGDANVTLDSHDAAPALSNDGKTLYVVAKYSNSIGGYLAALDATTLHTKSKVFLTDPRNGAGAAIPDAGTASPLVAPDGSVFYGILGNPYNGSRGFMLHFSGDLSQEFTPGAFGWDDTGSIVPASMVPGYGGTSSYLLFVKYNNYAGPSGVPYYFGDGVNKIAVLDPNATQLDNRNDSDPSLLVMKEVLTATGPTPDADFVNSGFPNAVHEWCINSTVVDPSSDSIYANSEDGKLYRWDLSTNTLTEPVVLTAGLGEAYTPTWMGPDGRVYAINNATLFSVGITGWGGHNGAPFTAPTYSTSATAAGTTPAHTYTLTQSSISRDGFTFDVSGVQSLNLYAGSGGNTINWQGTASGQVETVYGGTGVNTINFGDANKTVNSFSGAPVFEGQGSHNTVNVFDQGNTTTRNYVLTADSLSPNGGTGFGYGFDIQAANIYLGSGGNTLDWQGTPANSVVTVYTGTGTNTINFGDANNTLDGFQGTPVIQGQGSSNTVNVYDQGSTKPHTYVITADSLTRDGGTGYGGGTGFVAVNYHLGSGGNTIDWQGTAAGATTTVYTGTGTNTINYGDTGNTLNGFQGTPITVGQGDTSSNVYDQGSTTPHTYVITGSTFSRDGGVGYYSGIQAANVYLGAGGNTIDWQGTAAGMTGGALFTGTGANTVNIGDANNTLNGFQSPAVLVDQGSSNAVTVNDSGSATPYTYTITSSTVSRPGFTLDYSGSQSLTLEAGSGGNVINLQGTGAGAQPFDQVVAFGDSLSDTGNDFIGSGGSPGAPYYMGRFSNGPNWIDQLAQKLGVPDPQPSLAGGTNYAYGGATATSVYQGVPDLAQQVQQYLQAHATADPSALYTVLMGANDFFGGVTDPSVVANAVDAALNSLIAAGAKDLLVSDLPPQGITPDIQSQGPAAVAAINALDAGFRSDLYADVTSLQAANPGLQIHVLDLYSTSLALEANPAANGFTDTTDEGINAGPNADLSHYLFWDAVHPTTAGHALIADAAFGEVGGGVTVYAGTGTNTVNVGDASNTLNGLQSTAVVVGQGSTTLNVNDQGSSANHNYGVTGNSFTRDGQSLFYGNVQAANFGFGAGSNTVNWRAVTSPDTAFAANFSGGSDQVQGAYSAAATTVNGHVAMTGTVPAVGALTVTAQGVLDLSQSGAGTTAATSVSNQGTIDGSGHLALADSGNFTSGNLGVVLGGNSGTAYDQFQVGGTASLTGSLALSLVPGFVPTPGSTYTIVEDTGSNPVTGTFTGLPEGTLIPVNGVDGSNQPFSTLFQIHYAGTSVVLTDVAQPLVSADNPAVTVVTGQTATNTGTWTQTGFAGADVITASVGTITESGTAGSGTWSWSYPTNSTAQSQTVTITASDGQGHVATTTFTLTVNPDPTTTFLTPSANPSTYGDSVTFTATVSANAPGAGTPTGTVSFLDGTQVIGTGTLMRGTATFSTAALAAGGHTITASYGGDTNFGSGNSNAVAQSVGQRALVITADNSSKVEGNTLTFAGTEFATAGALPAPGLVNGDTVTSVTLTSAGAGAAAEDGGYSILPSAAVGSGLSNYAITYAPGTLTVTEPPIAGASDTLAAVVTGQASAVVEVATFTHAGGVEPAGDFTATVNWAIAGHTADPAVITEDGGGTYHVSATRPVFAFGTYAVTVSVGEDNTSTTVSDSQVVNQAATSTAVASSLNPSAVGQSVTFTATVSASAPGAGTPTGTVSFLDGTQVIGSGTLSGGVATFITSTLAQGMHAVTAQYGGDTNYQGSTSNSVTQTVKAFASTATVSSSANPSVVGQKVTFTATVKAASGTLTPTGSVQFLDGTTIIGTGTLSSGKATFSTTLLPLNGHSITVSYGGDGNFTGSTSAVLTQTVSQASTTTKVASSPRPSVFGQSVTFTATVSASFPGSGTPTGTVTFLDGTTPIGTGTLSGGTATFTTSALSVASHTISASYGGDTNYKASTSGSLTQSVGRAATTTVVISSLNPSVSGQSITFTATVTVTTPGSGTPTGTVTFRDGTKTIGTGTLNASGQATFMTSSLAVGSHSITAIYGTTTDYKSSTSAVLTQTVNAAGTIVRNIFGHGRINFLSPSVALAALTKPPSLGSTSAASQPATVSTVTVGLPPTSVTSQPAGNNGVQSATGTSGQQSKTSVAVLDKLFAEFGQKGMGGAESDSEDGAL